MQREVDLHVGFDFGWLTIEQIRFVLPLLYGFDCSIGELGNSGDELDVVRVAVFADLISRTTVPWMRLFLLRAGTAELLWKPFDYLQYQATRRIKELSSTPVRYRSISAPQRPSLLQAVARGAQGLLEPFRRQSKARECSVGAGAESVDYRAKLLIESLRVVGNVLRESWQRGQQQNHSAKFHGREGYRKTGSRLSAQNKLPLL